MFQLESVPGLKSSGYRRRLLIRGEATGITVIGDEIGAIVQFGELSLLAIHYDYFEAVDYHYYLVDRAGKQLDSVSTPPYFGFMQHLVRESENRIGFGFFGTDARWTISVVPSGYWGWRRSFRAFAKRYLHLAPANMPTR